MTGFATNEELGSTAQMNIGMHALVSSRRPPLPSQSKTEGIQSIQILRGAAALMVVLFHIATLIGGYGPGWFLRYAHVGQAGVDVFFIISGFIMAHVTYSKPQAPHRFLLNRVVRIVPLYWFATTLYVVGASAGFGLFGRVPLEPGFLLKSYLFIPIVGNGAGILPPVILQGWTLNYEMFFYVLFALALLLWPRRPHVTVVLLLTTAFLTAQVLPLPAVAGYYANPIIFEFAFGVLLASFFRAVPRLPGAAAVVMVLAGIALLLVSNSDPLSNRLLNWGLPSVLIVTGMLYFPRLEGADFNRPLIVIGNISYSIYLMHFIVVAALPKFFILIGMESNSLPKAYAFIALGLLGSIGIGMITHHAIEKPATRFFRKRSN